MEGRLNARVEARAGGEESRRYESCPSWFATSRLASSRGSALRFFGLPDVETLEFSPMDRCAVAVRNPPEHDRVLYDALLGLRRIRLENLASRILPFDLCLRFFNGVASASFHHALFAQLARLCRAQAQQHAEKFVSVLTHCRRVGSDAGRSVRKANPRRRQCRPSGTRGARVDWGKRTIGARFVKQPTA